MSSHRFIFTPLNFSPLLAKFIENRDIKSNQLSFNSVVGIFFVKSDEKNIDSELFSLWEYLNYGGFSLLSFRKIEIAELIIKLIEKKLFSLRDSIDKAQYETISLLIENPEEITRIFEEKKMNDKTFLKAKLADKKNLIETAMRNQAFNEKQFYLLLDEIKAKIYDKEGKKCVIAAFSCKDLKDFSLFEDFMKCNQTPRNIELFYHSKNHKKAFLDMQILFPEAFKFSYLTFLLAPNFRLLEKNMNNYQENMKKVLRIEQDSFKDTILYNGFCILNENEENIPSEDFILKAPQAFSKFTKNIGALTSFFNSEEGVFMNICGKFGSNSLLDMNLELSSNYYKFKDSYQNHCIFQTFFPKYSSYQRVLVILRPNLLHSDFDEHIINLYRINNFIIIKRDIIKLTEQQAYYLAKIEGIHETSLRGYLNFMLNGPVELVLMSNFAAIPISSIIAQGSGAKIIKKTPFLKVFFIKNINKVKLNRIKSSF